MRADARLQQALCLLLLAILSFAANSAVSEAAGWGARPRMHSQTRFGGPLCSLGGRRFAFGLTATAFASLAGATRFPCRGPCCSCR